MVTSLGGIGGATQYLRYPAAREGAAQQQANPAPNAAHPALANVVGELNAVTGPAQDMHVELDLGGGKQAPASSAIPVRSARSRWSTSRSWPRCCGNPGLCLPLPAAGWTKSLRAVRPREARFVFALFPFPP